MAERSRRRRQRNFRRVSQTRTEVWYLFVSVGSQPQGYRIPLRRGETRKVSFTITPRQMSLIDDAGKRVIEPGEFSISIDGSQVGLNGKFVVSGERTDVAKR